MGSHLADDLDRRTKLPPNPPQNRFMGYAVGHWEGDTLVVESSGMTTGPGLRTPGPRKRKGFPSDEMKIVERYRRPSYDILEATITITDPKVFTSPWTSVPERFCIPVRRFRNTFAFHRREGFQNLVSRPRGAEPIK
jgi:hypothetical protein